MAQVTSQIASASNGLVRAEVDWNDANGQITKGRLINGSTNWAKLRAFLNPPINGFSEISVDCGPGQTVTSNLPNNTVKFTNSTDPDDPGWKLIGVNLGMQYPSDPPA